MANPPGFWRHIKPHVLRARSGIIQINGINFNIDLELDPVMRHMYFGLYQSEITDLLKRFLRDGDTFIDVGANIGYISAFGLGLVGKAGEVHSFEPVPQYLERLQNIQKDNPDYHIHVNGVALGEDEGTSTISVTNLKNIGWNIMVPDFMSKDTVNEEVDITVTTLDHYLFQNNIQRLRFVKIDTEGYEFPVMKGFQQYLRNAKDRAKYMRGLHVHSSYILLILTYFPINYLDRSQKLKHQKNIGSQRQANQKLNGH